jgi:hypothetical protein
MVRFFVVFWVKLLPIIVTIKNESANFLDEMGINKID